jgi:cellulose synthase/poly-beta-1,6-N-acetylglucosamine synthase-like glycosyltransferase
MNGVTVVVPVHNGEALVRDTVASILAQRTTAAIDVLLVDDHSADGSSAILADLAASDRRIRVVPGPGRGAAAAINAGFREARGGLIGQVDQDVVLEPEWLDHLVETLTDPVVGAAQGYYLCAADARLFGRVMNLDLEQRYAAIRGCETDHVCTGNALYRAAALDRIGLLDESLGYGYDNDISYRLADAGWALRINRSARAVHRWREGAADYVIQQYGFGYGRIDLVAKHPHRIGGDAVSPRMMMLHPVIMLATLASFGLALGRTAIGAAASSWWTATVLLAAILIIERSVAAFRAYRRFNDAAAFAFPAVHLLRDVAWVAAIVSWAWRRLGGQPTRPRDSMTPRAVYRVNRADSAPAPKRPIA